MWHVRKQDNCIRILVGRPEENRSLGRSGKIILKFTCIYLAYDRVRWRGLVKVVMNLLVPYKVVNFLIS